MVTRFDTDHLRRGTEALSGFVTGARVLGAAGLLTPMRPDVALRAALALAREGLSPAAALAYSAARYPDRLAVLDERGTLTFPEASLEADRLAGVLEAGGVRAGDRVGLLSANHRGFLLATAALSSLQADVLLLNAASSGREVGRLLDSEQISHLVHDGALPVPERDRTSLHRLGEGPYASRRGGRSLLGGLPGRVLRPSRYVLMTSGTTGRPKGAARPVPLSLDPLVAMLSRLPLKVNDVTMIASPLFHAWGFAHLGLGLALSSSLVLRPRFDAEATLSAVAQHRVRVLVAVPVMLQRLVELPEATRRRYDTSSLEVVASSGSALPGDLATRVMDTFGEVLYNLYGSTEAAWATVAGPSDLRAHPRTAGRPPRGSRVLVVGDDGRPVGPATTGRILVSNSMVRRAADADAAGFVATGDLGHLDGNGLLFVDGRQDDMVVSGGENVYPDEVEEVLLSHPGVLEAAVAGVPDEEFGARLRAAVVTAPGHELSEDELRAFLRERIARFKVPRDIVFLSSLPRTATGKPRRRSIREAGGQDAVS